MYRCIVPVLVLMCSGWSMAEVVPIVTHESTVYTYTPPNNGSGPFWSAGCTGIVRLGDSVIVCEQQTGQDVPLLCNTRWRLHKRTGDTWSLLAEAEGYRQREPAILGTLGKKTLLLNVNDSTEPPGKHYGPCKPYTMKFSLKTPEVPKMLMPEWTPDTYFTDHSYRSFSADRKRSEVLMLNINAETSALFYALMNQDGKTLANGTIEFPIRSCYAQTALVNGAAYVFAVSDIVEPIEEWRSYKYEQRQRKWDYVFRIIYLTQSNNLRKEPFSKPLEIDNVDKTAGAIRNQDIHVAPNGDVYLLYTKRRVADALMQQKYFPDLSTLTSLELVIVRDGKILSRNTVMEAKAESQPGNARFHVDADGEVHVVLYATIDGVAGNWLMPLNSIQTTPKFIPIPLSQPVASFTLADTRAGNAPSNTIDLLGAAPNNTIVNAEIQLQKK